MLSKMRITKKPPISGMKLTAETKNPEFPGYAKDSSYSFCSIFVIAAGRFINRNAISWRVVITGPGVQIILTIGILQVPYDTSFF